MNDPTKLKYNALPRRGEAPRYGVSKSRDTADTIAWFVDLSQAKFCARQMANDYEVIDLVRGELVAL